MVTVQHAISPSSSVTQSWSVNRPEASRKKLVLALVGDDGMEVEPVGRDVTVHV
jgi:hypothetical protein